MNFKLSLVNLFLSPVAGGIARQRARARKHTDFFHEGIAIYCAPEKVGFLKEAVNAARDYFGEDWGRYQKNLKYIVLDDELQTILWVAQRTVIIRESDNYRLESVKHLTASLIGDMVCVQVCRDNRCSKIIWKEGIIALSKAKAETKRLEYLSQE